MAWAEQEMVSLDLGDQRLNRRGIQMLQSLSDAPSASINRASGSAAEVKAAYRLLDNDQVDAEALLNPHWQQTEHRASKCSIVLCVQDTTELNFHQRQIPGLGRLSYEAQRGMYLHPTLILDAQRTPLGTLDAWMWARQDKPQADIKESLRWIEGYERVAELAERLEQSQVVYIADREGDIAQLFQCAKARDFRADVLIRMSHNRVLEGGKKLFDPLSQAPCIGSVKFTLPKGRRRAKRCVVQELRACPVTICPKQNGGVKLWALEAREVNPPAGSKPIVWRLLTNIDILSQQTAIELIDWYRSRWEIEMFFHVLKKGFDVQALQLRNIERLQNALALYLICAWRLHYLMRLGRSHPQLSCEALLEPLEWKAAYFLNRQKPPSQPPALAQVMRLIAQMGGFMGRKGDKDPGLKTLWLGWESLRMAVVGMEIGLNERQS